MIAQRLRNPLFAGHIQHQAAAAIDAATRVMRSGGHHHETLLDHLAATAVDLEIQGAREPEHQLRVFVAMDDQVVAVLAKREDRSHRGSPGSGRQSTPSGPTSAVTGLT
ncbi:hypothetical protein D9M73_169090 [compost metagenome]